jgi:hypothetical protein
VYDIHTNPVVADYSTTTLPYTANTPISTSDGTIQTSGSAFDYNALLSQLSHKPVGARATSTTRTNTTDPWEIIPASSISTTSTQHSQTPLQRSLLQYGNVVGALIQRYDIEHRDQVQVSQNAFRDRQDSTKRLALASIGADMQQTGQSMLQIKEIPPVVSATHQALGNAYVDSGKKLAAMADALPASDTDLRKAIETHNASVEVFIKSYVALAVLFQAYGVSFESTDAGSVFTFTPSAQ